MHTLSSRIQFLVALVVILSLVLAAARLHPPLHSLPRQPNPPKLPLRNRPRRRLWLRPKRRAHEGRRTDEGPRSGPDQGGVLPLLPTKSAARRSSSILMAAGLTPQISGIRTCPAAAGIMAIIRP